ncbi:MAG TPA: dTDP-glucose 4,6-dehydratase [Gemmatimonadales bacterium]
MHNLLVTGGAGFIGANFVHYWLAAHPEDRVVVLDALTYAGNLANLEPCRGHPGLVFCDGDIRDRPLVEQLLRAHHVDTLVHFAAESHVDRSITGPDAFIGTNVLGTHELLKAVRKVWLEDGEAPDGARFHHISTDEVYGSLGPDDAPVDEGSAYAPNSPYAASKAASDHLVRAYHRTYGVPVTVSNCSNNYGPYQFPEKLIPLMLVNAVDGRALPVYGDGQNVRDWLYVEDHCRAVERILLEGRTGETYNVGGGEQRTNLEVVRLLCRLLDEAFAGDEALARRFPNAPAARGKEASSLLTFVPDRPGHDRRYAIDGRKLEAHLGFVPMVGFEEGIRRVVAWYLAHESWWRGILDGSYRDRAGHSQGVVRE